MWIRLPLPELDIPIHGFTFPEHDRLFILNPSGLVQITLARRPEARVVADPAALETIYDRSTVRLHWGDRWHQVHGADGGDITLCDHPNGDRLVVDPHGDALLIMDIDEEELRQELDDFFVSDGVWTVAGFSEDFRWLIVCDPEKLRVFQLQTEAGRSQSA